MTQAISNDAQGIDVEPEVAQPQAEAQPGAEVSYPMPARQSIPAISAAANQQPRDPWLTLAALVLLGGIAGVAYYLGFVRPYLLPTYYSKPLLDLAKISGYTGTSANEWAFTWIVLFACYYGAFRICPPAEGVTRLFRRFTLVLICGFAIFYAANLLFMYPVGAADLFDQIFRARLTAHYGFNPFTTLPSSIVGDTFQQYVAWKGDPSPYGPIWESLGAGVSLLAGESLWANLIEFKLLVIGAYGVSIGLTYGILRAVKPEWALRGTLFFAWNPLVLFEVAGNGHNDAVVVMFVLLAIFFLVKAWRLAVLPALMAGALTKFIPILLVPIAIGALWRDRGRTAGRRRKKADEENREGEKQAVGGMTRSAVLSSLAIGVVLAVGLAAIVYAPFWTGPESILPRNRQTLFTASIPKVVLDYLTRDFGVGEAVAQWWVRNIAYGIVGLVAVGLTLWVWRTPDATTPEGRTLLLRRTLIAFYEIIFTYLLVASLWFQPWYLLWLIGLTAPVAAVAGITYVHRTLLFCLGGVLNYFVWDFIWLWNRTEFRNIQITSAIAIYALPVVYTLYVWFGRGKTNDEARMTKDNPKDLQAAITT